MKNALKYNLLVMAMALVASPLAFARDHKTWDPPKDPNCNNAPEVDPGLAVAGLTMLGGSLTVLRARRHK